MTSTPIFADRLHAGKELAQAIFREIQQNFAENTAMMPIVYALPRGGLPVAAPVAKLLCCPLDIIVAKKISLPDNPELAIGAVTADGQVIWSKHKPLNSRVCQTALTQAEDKARKQQSVMGEGRHRYSAENTIAILVDDGIATGMTIAVAALSLRSQKPAEIWICAPVAPPELIDQLYTWGDRVIVLHTPDPFLSVSRFYDKFPQVETSEAMSYL